MWGGLSNTWPVHRHCALVLLEAGLGIQAAAPGPVPITLSTTGNPKGPSLPESRRPVHTALVPAGWEQSFQIPTPAQSGLHIDSDRLTASSGLKCRKHDFTQQDGSVCSPWGTLGSAVRWEFSEADSAQLHVSGARLCRAQEEEGTRIRYHSSWKMEEDDLTLPM